MVTKAAGILTGSFLLFCIITVNAVCPKNIPLEINGNCYRIVTEPLPFKDARDNCPKLDANAWIASVKEKEVIDKLQEKVYEYVHEKLESTLFWIGLAMEDTSVSKKVDERNWKWHYDEKEFVQKEYTLWETEGGPKKGGLNCATLNASTNFMVKPVDCGGPRVPVICMMKEGEECRDGLKPYMIFGKYCLAGLNGAAEYNKILGACSPNKPTPYLEDMKESVEIAAKNLFLGGGLFLNIKKIADNEFIYLGDGSPVDPDLWEEGEPRNVYECVGLSLQSNYELKLKTINCDFLASSICAIEGPSEK